jgi:hypothetical protein
VYVELYDLLPANTVYAEQFVQDPDQPAGQGWWYIVKWWYDFGPINYTWPGNNCPSEGMDDYVCWAGEVGPRTSGRVHIQYQVKVLHDFVGDITNKADVQIYYGNHSELMPLIATSEIRHVIYMPIIFRQ